MPPLLSRPRTLSSSSRQRIRTRTPLTCLQHKLFILNKDSLPHEYPFDISFATSPSMNFADLDLSQSPFLNPGQLPWSESKSDTQQLFVTQPQPQPPSEVLSIAPQQVVYFTPESDEDSGSESGESDTAEPSDGPDGDDDGDFLPNRSSRSRTRSRRTSSVSVSSSSGSVRPTRPCRLSAPVPVPNLTKKSRGRRVPTTPVFTVQGGVQKIMRMYRCMVDGCNKCFARGEHLKRHVRSIHTNEKREFYFFFLVSASG